jgi:hypothetical protein
MKTYVCLRLLAKFFLEWQMFRAKVTENIKTHFKFNNFLSENRAIYEIM